MLNNEIKNPAEQGATVLAQSLEDGFVVAEINGNAAEVEKVLTSIRQIVRATDMHSRHVTRLSGLTSSQLMLLKVVRDHGASKIGEIAKTISLSQATLTSILDRLETMDYVHRERSTEDRRKVQVQITELGREVLKRAPEPLQVAFTRQFCALKDWERNMIQASLQRVAGMMDPSNVDASTVLDAVSLHPNN